MTARCRARAPLGLIAVLAAGVSSTLVASPACADPEVSAWERLRMCESHGRYDLDAHNGYYGAYQFSLWTWRGVGGDGYPHEASPAEQDYRALYLYRLRGWSPWPSCTGKLSLTEDDDARSQRVPSYEESAHIAGADRRRRAR